MSCCLLTALTNKLLTRTGLMQFGIINTDICVLCNSGSESVDHLFVSCSYSSYIWTICKLRLDLPPDAHDLNEEAISFKT